LVQLFQLATLALPADVLGLRFDPGSTPVEEEEPSVSVALVERLDALDRGLQQGRIPRKGRVVGIAEIGEQAEE